MMRHVLLAGVLHFSVVLGAQTNVWLADGTRWVEGYSCAPPGIPGCWEVIRDRFTVEGDTLLMGRQYKKVIRLRVVTLREVGIPPGTCSDTVSVQTDLPPFVIRDSLGMMYRFLNGADQLMYDMALALGDTIPTSTGLSGTWVVNSIDSILVDGTYRRRFHSNMVTLTEGIGWRYGVNQGFFMPIYMGYCNHGPFCYSIGSVSYIPPDGAACEIVPASGSGATGQAGQPVLAPNPASGETYIDLPQAVELARLVDAQGRTVSEFGPLPAGRTEIQLTGLRAGVYLLELGASDVRYVLRLVLEGQ